MTFLEDGRGGPQKLHSIYGPDNPRFKMEQSAFKRPLKWSNIIILLALHLATIGFYIYIAQRIFYFQTFVFGALLGALSGIATSAGSHRLWSHRSYKAHWILKLFMLVFQAISMNGSALSYARDHRTHHKFSDTDADPKNPTRGLFYSHIGWWLVKKTETVKEAGRRLDFSDLYNDPLVYYQHKFYVPIFLIFGALLPTLIPVYCWNEDPLVAFGGCVVIRIFVILHHLFTVNSLAHYFGYRPYDFRIRPSDHRFVNYLSFGEGIHNYHHVFPFDYRINDRPQWELFTPPVIFIQVCHLLGLVTDLKIASPKMVQEIIDKRGIRALYDPVRGLTFRIFNSLFDWSAGFIVSFWICYPALIYKLAKHEFYFKI